MKIAIFGSAGFVGRHLEKALRDHGHEVTGIDPKNGPVNDVEISKGTGAVLYLAQSPYYRQVPEMAWHLLDVNAVFATKAAQLAVKAGARRFIYASTGNVYAPSFEPMNESSPLRRDNWYSLSKVHGEESMKLMASYLDITIVRFFGLYGPGQTGTLVPNIIGTIRKNKPVFIDKNPVDPFDNEGLSISLCYIGDAVEILISLLDKTGPLVLNIAGEEAISMVHFAYAASRHIGIKPVFEKTEMIRDTNLIADITLLREIIDPSFTPLQTGLAKTVESRLMAS
ncbi:NAD(P)-dependent oxidoreductase [bacterium]|nr:NAD(P)-dependent oxidoreductase [bacterium]